MSSYDVTMLHTWKIISWENLSTIVQNPNHLIPYNTIYWNQDQSNWTIAIFTHLVAHKPTTWGEKWLAQELQNQQTTYLAVGMTEEHSQREQSQRYPSDQPVQGEGSLQDATETFHHKHQTERENSVAEKWRGKENGIQLIEAEADGR